MCILHVVLISVYPIFIAKDKHLKEKSRPKIYTPKNEIGKFWARNF
jgi:hypothetical protein